MKKYLDSGKESSSVNKKILKTLKSSKSKPLSVDEKFPRNIFQTEEINKKQDYFETVDLRTTSNDTDLDILSNPESITNPNDFSKSVDEETDSQKSVRDFKKQLYDLKKNMEN